MSETVVDAQRVDPQQQFRAELLAIVREELRAAREELRPQPPTQLEDAPRRSSAEMVSERQRPPFLPMFTPFRSRAILLVNLPVIAGMAMVIKLVADATISDRGMVNVSPVLSNFVVPYLAWSLHRTMRSDGDFCSLVSEATHARRIPAKFVTRLRVGVAAMLGLLLCMLAICALLTYLIATKTSRLQTIFSWDPSASPDGASDEEIGLSLGWVATLPLVIWLAGTMLFQIIIVVVCVSVELHDVKELITTTRGDREWQAKVVPAATHLACTTLPTLNRGWSAPLSVFVVVTAWQTLVLGTHALETGDVLFIVFTVLHVNALVMYTLIPLMIARGCKAIQKALTARAFEGLARSPEAALRFTLLRDTLESSGHFGLRVCGLHLTPRVIGRAAGLFITLSALLPRLPQAQ